MFHWCFIGTGRLAHQVAKQITESGKHAVVSCYTRNYEKAKAFGEQFGAQAYEQVEDAITAKDVDGVYIVTPHNVHFKYAKLALELGKPVFCEKAFTVTAEETDALIALAREKNLYLAEAMWTWFSPAANQVKKWIDEEAIGRVQSADFTYHMMSLQYAPRVSDPKRAGGALLDITIYPITYAYRLWGMPVQIESRGVIENGIDVGEEVTLTFSCGATAHISASIADIKGWERMRIQGEDGIIHANEYHAHNKVTMKRNLQKKVVFRGPGPRMNSYLDEFDQVAEDIRQGKKESAMVPLQVTSDVMHILDRIREQIGLQYDALET
jgi:predicted dehydrogenase